MNLAEIRREYKLEALDETGISHDPFRQFERWLLEAIEAKVNEPTAMAFGNCNTRWNSISKDGIAESIVRKRIWFFYQLFKQKR